MTTSVAMCTYNGAKYIEEQLRSIINQTHPIHEIVICDDGSTDDTIQIIESIKADCSIPITILRNIKPVGVCKNFFKALNACKGDIIFLSDQDDIWLPTKAQNILSWFSTHPDKDVVFTNASFINAEGATIGNHTLFESIYFTKRAKAAFDKGFALELFLNFNRATGATMALRRNLIPQVTNLKPYADYVYHDAIISMVAISRNSLGYIDDCLISYRLHSNQTAGMNVLACEQEAEHYLSPFYGNIELGQYAVNMKPRADFALFRQVTIYKKNGIFSIIHNQNKYLHFYQKHWLIAFLYDIAVNVKSLLKRTRGQVRTGHGDRSKELGNTAIL